MPIAVVTSKPAQKDLEKIKTAHADLVTGMMNQKMRMDAYNQQKAVETTNQNVMQNELEKERMTAQSAAEKNAMDFQIKQSELEIKRAALAQP